MNPLLDALGLGRVPEELRWLIATVIFPAVGAVWLAWERFTGRRGTRRKEQRDALLALVDQLQEELRRSAEMLVQYRADTELLRQARWKLDDTLRELRDAALASRAMVHEMERRTGLPETAFPPLPAPAGLGNGAAGLPG